MTETDTIMRMVPKYLMDEFREIVEEVSVKAISAGILNHRTGAQAHFEIVAFAYRILQFRIAQ